jgi:hypothetical protein
MGTLATGSSQERSPPPTETKHAREAVPPSK